MYIRIAKTLECCRQRAILHERDAVAFRLGSARSKVVEIREIKARSQGLYGVSIVARCTRRNEKATSFKIRQEVRIIELAKYVIPSVRVQDDVVDVRTIAANVWRGLGKQIRRAHGNFRRRSSQAYDLKQKQYPRGYVKKRHSVSDQNSASSGHPNGGGGKHGGQWEERVIVKSAVKRSLDMSVCKDDGCDGRSSSRSLMPAF